LPEIVYAKPEHRISGITNWPNWEQFGALGILIGNCRHARRIRIYPAELREASRPIDIAFQDRYLCNMCIISIAAVTIVNGRRILSQNPPTPFRLQIITEMIS